MGGRATGTEVTGIPWALLEGSGLVNALSTAGGTTTHSQSVQNTGREEEAPSGRGGTSFGKRSHPLRMVTQGPRGAERVLSQRSQDQPNHHQGPVLLPHPLPENWKLHGFRGYSDLKLESQRVKWGKLLNLVEAQSPLE